jgi:tetratricopeptide (TPR) repeat protein
MKTALGLRPATNSAADLNALKLAIIRAPNMRPNEPYYAVAVARLLFQFGLMPDGRALLQKDLKMDPRDYEAWYSLALSDEKTNKRPAAIPARQRIATLDPFNAPSLLELGRDLKAAGDLAGAKAIIAKINSFAPGSPEAKSAQTEFGS